MDRDPLSKRKFEQEAGVLPFATAVAPMLDLVMEGNLDGLELSQVHQVSLINPMVSPLFAAVYLLELLVTILRF